MNESQSNHSGMEMGASGVKTHWKYNTLGLNRTSVEWKFSPHSIKASDLFY
jgi:hypothetical protein